jgi:uncharacterized delta-60 repeat protein
MRRSWARLGSAILVVPSVVWLPSPASAAPGDLDPTFGSGGIVTTDFGGGDDVLRAMAVQPDGKMVLAGWSGEHVAVARLNANGMPDSSFGQGGSAVIDAGPHVRPNEYQFAGAAAIQPDGRIVVVGGSGSSFLALRLRSDGAIDTTFGESGFVRVSLASGWANAVVVQPSGSIVMAGPAGVEFGLVRLLPDGSLDSTFGLDGIVQTPVEGRGVVNAMAQAGDDLVVAGAIAKRYSRTLVVARYGPDGTLVESFGDAGLAVASGCAGWSEAHAIAVDSVGHLVVAGTCGTRQERLEVTRFAADGTADTGFGTDGVVITDTKQGYQDVGYSVALDGSGRILVAGLAQSSPSDDWLVARYRDDGALDRSFGARGIALLPLHPYEGAWAVAPLASGEVVVAGTSAARGGDLAVARLSERGVLEPAFGVGGVGAADLPGGPDGAAAVIQQSNGMFLVSGSASGAFALARYTPNGTLDPTFGQGGRVNTPQLGGAIGEASALTIDPEGRLVLAGGTNFFGVPQQQRGFQVARYLPDGTIDTSFAGIGIVRTDTDRLLSATAVSVLPDGRIVVGGIAKSGFGLARYLPNGELDPSFADDGVVTTSFGSNTQAYGLVLQPDGRVVLAGRSPNGFALARYDVDGSLDPTFGDGGLVTTAPEPGYYGASALTIDSDGRLIAAGQIVTGECDAALVRYEPDGTLDASFGESGVVTTDLGAGCERLSELRVQADGKIVAVGGAGRNNTHVAVLRYLNDGSLDETFGAGGIVSTFTGAPDWAYGVVIQPNGRIVAAGQGASDFALVRLMP